MRLRRRGERKVSAMDAGGYGWPPARDGRRLEETAAIVRTVLAIAFVVLFVVLAGTIGAR